MLLKEPYRKSLIKILESVNYPIEVWAYGSRVNGTAHDGSDLDLVIRTPDLSPIPMDIFIDLKEKIEDSTIPIFVEIHDWARLPESFHKNILNRYEPFFRTGVGKDVFIQV